MELVERAYDVSVFGVHAAACTAGVLPTFDIEQPASCRRLLRQGRSSSRATTSSAAIPQPWLDDATVRDVPHPGEHIAAGRPVCTVFANGVQLRRVLCSPRRARRLVYSELESWSSVAA